MHNGIDWFEIPAKNFKRAVKFYNTIFKTKTLVTNVMGFDMAVLTVKKGSVGGAILHGKGYAPSTKGTVVYLNGGSDLNKVLFRVKRAGGKVVIPKTFVSKEIGYFAWF